MEKINTLRTLIIVPNIHLPEIKADFIISARDIDGKYYVATTDTRKVYEHFWNLLISNEDKVPAISHMLYRLKEEYGEEFRYIQPNKPIDDDRPNN